MKNAPRFWLITSMIVAGALLRILPHPWSFTPIGAMALFAGATFARKRYALLVPLLTMFLGDVLMEATTGEGLHSGMPIIYGCFALTVLIGWLIRSRRSSVLSVGLAGTLSATVFYLVTNFWVWTWSSVYARTLDGLITCYIAGLPFYRNDLLAHWIYSGLLFGTFVWMERRYPVFRAEAFPK